MGSGWGTPGSLVSSIATIFMNSTGHGAYDTLSLHLLMPVAPSHNSKVRRCARVDSNRPTICVTPCVRNAMPLPSRTDAIFFISARCDRAHSFDDTVMDGFCLLFFIIEMIPRSPARPFLIPFYVRIVSFIATISFIPIVARHPAFVLSLAYTSVVASFFFQLFNIHHPTSTARSFFRSHYFHLISLWLFPPTYPPLLLLTHHLFFHLFLSPHRTTSSHSRSRFIAPSFDLSSGPPPRLFVLLQGSRPTRASGTREGAEELL